jgi:ADP-heptose:LPS heptosyltransferase
VSQPEVLRWLEVAALAGAQPVVLEPVLHAKAGTGPEPGGTGSTLATGSRPANEPRRVVVHAGASDPRRRWPSRCFAEVAANVAREGYDVIIIGGAEDTLVAHDVRDRARRLLRSPVADPVAAGRISAAAGRLTLSDVVHLLAHAAAFLGNDSGPRHLAQALGCPTVAVFWGPNAINAAPFSRSHHRIHLGWRTACPLCGAVSALGTERCAHDVSYVDDVSPEAVYEDLSRLLLQ